MSKIGILLPGSTLYPSIGIDFLQGFKTCAGFYREDSIELIVHPIGYGIKEKEIYQQVEKWLLSENPDVIILYAEDRLASILSPLFNATGKLLIITNPGAQYPLTKSVIANTIFHSMNDCLHSFLTGRHCSELTSGNKKAIVATSFYDGGYQHCHAITNAYEVGGGEVLFNFVSQFKKETFTVAPIQQFIEQHPGVSDVLCLFSGDLKVLFYEQIAPIAREFNLSIYGSPMMFDNTPGDFETRELSIPSSKGYIGWSKTLESMENKNFQEKYRSACGREANLFVLQGWEVALILFAYLHHRYTTTDVAGAIELFRCSPIASPRGVLQLSQNNTILAPAYLVNTYSNLEVTVEGVIEDTATHWQQMVDQIPDTSFSTWQNTYLCI